MTDAAYIAAAARTAGGRRGGRPTGWHPADLAGQVLNALVDRTRADPALIEDVIMGLQTMCEDGGLANVTIIEAM